MNFFVLRLDNEKFSNEERLARWKSRVNYWENVCTKQFQLVYFGKFNYEDIEEMPVHEREFFYGLLIKQKTDEKEQYEKSLEEAKRKSGGR